MEKVKLNMNDIVKKTILNLNRNNMAGYYVNSIGELHEFIKLPHPWMQNVSAKIPLVPN